ncbi:M66 family metalloprotease [Acinetobacter bereziniae]|uniref:M66 family metalloprotease n=1 Tax=Acinetobacter bereziniae TaxID=106648 RepID=UPI001116E4C2|nr:M66 family metalloprotease [Acinetobacter bereziniae]TNL56564.1 glycosyl transferase [Acinetobacter bereziniae]
MHLRFKYLTICTLSAMLIACGGGGESHSVNDQPSNLPQNPGDGTNELPGDGTPEIPDNGSGGSNNGSTETPPNSGSDGSNNGSIETPPENGSGRFEYGSTETPPNSGSDGSNNGSTETPPENVSGGSNNGSTGTPPENGSGGSNNGSEGNTGTTPPTVDKYPEPVKNKISNKILGFYDFNGQGENRLLRNDLTGNFAAMVQFVQSHAVNPKNNEQDKMPRLTTEKDALLLVTPLVAMGELNQLQAEIYQGNQLIRTVNLKEPSRLAASDQSNQDDRARVMYSKQAWSLALKWNEVRPGLSIRVIDPVNNRSGTLGGSDIDFAAPGELVVQSIRLGLLTDAPKSNGHYMLLEPEKAGTDYLQTIPAAKMIVSKYEEMKLNRVMVASGVIYDSASATNGGVYDGDMRENTAKSTFSVGINLANWGVTSSSMQSQEQPQLTQSVVIHHARGKYANGESNHGLSGGNGILTLIDSIGNEFSHEIGHHYGLGHYPGSVETSGSPTNYFWSAHHADSGWGYIAFRNKMRGNLNWGSTNLGDGSNGVPNFQNLYAYGWDAMSGGASASSISKYTHYTGYSTWLKIQPAFDKYIWDANSITGYKKWNANTRQMVDAQPKTPNSGNVWYNSADGNFLKPRLFSVPVYTILGGYDPVNQVGIVYPAARGNWGNVFNLPQVNTSSTAASCWLNVQYASKVEHIALAPQRVNAGSNANKFHVNLAQSDTPQNVDLYCQKTGQQAVKLSSISIPVAVEAMTPFVTIGKEAEYSALRKIEMPQLEQALLNNQGKAVVKLDANSRLLFDSYRLFKTELSPNAQLEMVRYTQQQIKLYRLNRWINAYRVDLESGNAEAIEAFNRFVAKLELNNDFNLNEVSSLKNGTNCLKVETLSDGKLNAYISGKSACTGDDSEQWIYDAMGKIHSKKYMDQCLASQAGVINLASCNNESSAQAWMINSTLQRIEQGSKCFDLEYGYLNNNRARLISYNCGTGGNQKWTSLLSNNSLILAATSSANLPLIKQLLIH